MSNKITLGKQGESLALSYIIKRGYKPIKQNFRWNRYEVDIVAEKKDTLHFIEVKTRTTTTFGEPEKSVSKEKIARMLDVASYFIHSNDTYHGKNIQFDILAILMKKGSAIRIELFEDIYLYQ